MAKSIRSKTKRTFRNKKREDSVYAVTEAARLHRINAKLAAIVSKDSTDDVPVHDKEKGEDFIPGWCWFATFGLFDSSDINAENMEAFVRGKTGQALLEDRLKHEETNVSREPADAMSLDTEPIKRISTHGPRRSRREEWRLSKGLDPKPKRNGINRQGGLVGRRKAGRAKRRR